MNKIELQSNVTCTMLNTTQYKDVILTIRFLTALNRKSMIIRTLLSQMLCDRCEKWPTKQALSGHLDDLYGASVIAKDYNYGKCNVFEFRIKGLNDQYTNENTYERLYKTVEEFLFHPLMNQGLLDEEMFQEAKREYIMANARRVEQPQAKAVSKACALLGQGQALSETQLIQKAEIEAITLNEVSEEYKRMLQQDQIMIYVIGKLDEELTERYVRRFFPFEARELQVESVYTLPTIPLIEESETLKIDQTILVMMFSTQITIASEDYWKLRVANGLFGQLPTSLLFQEVREKRSLCYSISSNALSYEGGLLCSTGIQKSRVNEVKECILEQVERMRNGDFKEEELSTSINMLKNAVYGSYDDPLSTLNFVFQNELLHRNETIEESIQTIESTTKQDIMRIFKQLVHCVTFSLEQEEENEEAY